MLVNPNAPSSRASGPPSPVSPRSRTWVPLHERRRGHSVSLNIDPHSTLRPNTEVWREPDLQSMRSSSLTRAQIRRPRRHTRHTASTCGAAAFCTTLLAFFFATALLSTAVFAMALLSKRTFLAWRHARLHFAPMKMPLVDDDVPRFQLRSTRAYDVLLRRRELARGLTHQRAPRVRSESPQAAASGHRIAAATGLLPKERPRMRRDSRTRTRAIHDTHVPATRSVSQGLVGSLRGMAKPLAISDAAEEG